MITRVKVGADLVETFADIEGMVFYSWLSQPFLTSLSDVEQDYQEDIAQLQHCEVMKPVLRERGCLMWLDVEAEKMFPISAAYARRKLTRFASTKLVECGFSAVIELLVNIHGRFDISKRDLRLMLTQLEPRIGDLSKRKKHSPRTETVAKSASRILPDGKSLMKTKRTCGTSNFSVSIDF